MAQEDFLRKVDSRMLAAVAAAGTTAHRWGARVYASATELVMEYARAVGAAISRALGKPTLGRVTARAVTAGWKNVLQSLCAQFRDLPCAEALRSGIVEEFRDAGPLSRLDRRAAKTRAAGGDDAGTRLLRKELNDDMKQRGASRAGRPSTNYGLSEFWADECEKAGKKLSAPEVIRRLSKADPGHPILKRKNPAAALRSHLNRARK
jgi:hypothetical protein